MHFFILTRTAKNEVEIEVINWQYLVMLLLKDCLEGAVSISHLVLTVSTTYQTVLSQIVRNSLTTGPNMAGENPFISDSDSDSLIPSASSIPRESIDPPRITSSFVDSSFLKSELLT